MQSSAPLSEHDCPVCDSVLTAYLGAAAKRPILVCLKCMSVHGELPMPTMGLVINIARRPKQLKATRKVARQRAARLC